ncbi:hypothetical protein DVH24_014578 [Malus domestica]|uniref:beta-galactosidase n=1 Tax=Malus domestica TaxID=3750 RepID=A0A498KQI3_MALDO|nr:hypothetical protein DVH24_014578 [Malus domestica]
MIVKEEARSTEGLDRSSLHWVREFSASFVSPVSVDREKISKGIVISTLLICFAVRAKWSRVVFTDSISFMHSFLRSRCFVSLCAFGYLELCAFCLCYDGDRWNIQLLQYDFGGRKDLVKFVKTVAEAGLYVHLRIEIEKGSCFYDDQLTFQYFLKKFYCVIVFVFQIFNSGFPLWLHFIPGIRLRTDNEPFKVSSSPLYPNCLCCFSRIYVVQAEMQRFTKKIVDMMKEKLYASQGGPIILSQIENEYGNIDEPKCGTKCKHHYEYSKMQ